MGFQDRDYNHNEFEQDHAWNRQQRARDRSSSGHSIITAIIVVNVVIWLLDSFSPLVDPSEKGVHWLNRNILCLDPSKPWAIWSYLGYGFAHASLDSKTSFWHIAFNMLGLFFLGRPVVQRLGKIEFLKFYLVSIVVCGVGYVILAQVFGLVNYIVGASGAVSAVVFLFIFMYPKEKVLFWGIFPMYAWVLGIIVVLADIRNALNPENHVAWQVHLIGAAFAIAYFKLNWNFERLPLPSFAGLAAGAKPKLKVHNPDEKLEKLKIDADRVLEKIAKEGEASLTRGERKTLNQYSKAIRNRND
jgi:membrane associated rhomboid family serine protease